MQAAENLYEKMWGQNLDQKLKVHSEVIGVRWKYLSKDYLDLLQLPTLGYLEDVLLFRDEYSTAMASFNPEETRKGGSHGVVVTGQPGIGIVHAKTLYIYPFPKITWALSDSNEKIDHPCDAFLDSAQQGRIWVVQTTSPLESRWEKWQELYSAGMFVMKYFLLKRLRLSGMCHGFCFSLSDPFPIGEYFALAMLTISSAFMTNGVLRHVFVSSYHAVPTMNIYTNRK